MNSIAETLKCNSSVSSVGSVKPKKFKLDRLPKKSKETGIAVSVNAKTVKKLVVLKTAKTVSIPVYKAKSPKRLTISAFNAEVFA